MVTWVTPSTATSGSSLTAALWNTYVRDNMTYLKAAADAATFSGCSVQNALNLATGSENRFGILSSPTVDIDTDGFTTASGSVYFLQVPTGLDGYYVFGAWVAFGTSSVGQIRRVGLELNSSRIIYDDRPPHLEPGEQHGVTLTSPLLHLVAGDQMSIVALQDSGATQNCAIKVWATRLG